MPIGETRRFKRAAVNLPVTFTVHESHTQEVHPKRAALTGTMADISRGGCLVLADVFLPRGTMVTVHVDPAPFVKPAGPVDLPGKVTMVRMVARKQYKLGVEFTDLADPLRNAISTFCGD